MAEETAPEVVKDKEKEKEPGNSGNMKNLLLIFGFSFLATVIIVCTVLLIVFRNNNSNGKNAPPPQAAPEAAAKEKEIGPLVSLGNEMIVNINGDDGSPHYLKVNLSLEADSEKSVEELKKRIPQVRDLVITILTSKTKEKIDEKEGKESIRSEIINNVNRYMVTGQVRNVYFEDFMMQ